MAAHWKYLLVASAALGIAGCTSETAQRWNSEAGSQIDNGSFGNATMHNILAQACYGPRGYGASLKGGTVTDPVVVLDPKSTAARPIYRVHCNGRLNGKYAQVIFGEYIASAVPPPEFGIRVEAGGE